MSTIAEQVWEGFYNEQHKANLSEDQNRVAKMRLAKCGVCPFKKERFAQKIIESTVDKIFKREVVTGEFKGYSCGICGCILSKKVYSFSSSCPADPTKHGIEKQWTTATFDKDKKVVEAGVV